MMRGLDTNVLVRYLTQDDPVQSRKATALIEGAAGQGEALHVDVVVLCEVVWVLRGAYAFDKATVAETVGKILDAGAFSIGNRDLLREALAAYRTGQGDFADHVLGLHNRESGCRATVTLDRALRRSSLFTVL